MPFEGNVSEVLKVEICFLISSTSLHHGYEPNRLTTFLEEEEEEEEEVESK